MADDYSDYGTTTTFDSAPSTYDDLAPVDTSQAVAQGQANDQLAQNNINAIDSSSTAPNTPSKPSSGSVGGALSKALSALGLGGGNTSNTAALNAAVGLLSAYGHYKQNAGGNKLPPMPALGALPALPGSSTGGYGPNGGYGYQNYAGANGGMGYAPRTAAPPPPSYFTYGSGPEHQFFQQVTGKGGPITPVTMARGGSVPRFADGGLPGPGGALGAATPSNPVSGASAPGSQPGNIPGAAIGNPTMGAQLNSPPPPAALPSVPQMRQPGQIPSAPIGRPSMGAQLGGPSAPTPPTPQPVMQPGSLPSAPVGRPSMGAQLGGPSAPPPPAQIPAAMPGNPMRSGVMGMNRRFASGGSVPSFDMGGMVPNMGMTPQGPPPAPMGAPQAQRPSTMMQRMQAVKPFARGGMVYRAMGGSADAMGNPMPDGTGTSNMPPLQQPFAAGGQGALSAAMGPGVSRHVTGPGDGTSDSIPARLANGEYVIDAQAVSMLGNGDNSAGAKRLDEFRKQLRAHKGAALAKGRMAPDAKPIHKYMGGQ